MKGELQFTTREIGQFGGTQGFLLNWTYNGEFFAGDTEFFKNMGDLNARISALNRYGPPSPEPSPYPPPPTGPVPGGAGVGQQKDVDPERPRDPHTGKFYPRGGDPTTYYLVVPVVSHDAEHATRVLQDWGIDLSNIAKAGGKILLTLGGWE